MNAYINRLNAAFAIAGLLVMAPLMAMTRLSAPTTAPHCDSIVKKRASSDAARDGHRVNESDESASHP